jgi:hypothetical protein
VFYYKGKKMNALIYAWPAPKATSADSAAPVIEHEATVTALPIRTTHGLQEALPFEWPTDGTSALKPHSPRVSDPTNIFDPQPTARKDLPSAQQWAMRLVHAVVEVVNGVRPASQLTRWLTPEVLAQVQRQVAHQAMPRLNVRSIHVHETDDGVAEVSSVFGTPNRSFALALRLEGFDGRWKATTLIFGL